MKTARKTIQYKGQKFKLGDLVKIKNPSRYERGTARIAEFYSDIKGGMCLTNPLGGFVSWNVCNIEKAGK